jgi:hypothetical protein
MYHKIPAEVTICSFVESEIKTGRISVVANPTDRAVVSKNRCADADELIGTGLSGGIGKP